MQIRRGCGIYFIFSPVRESVYNGFEGVITRLYASPVMANTLLTQETRSEAPVVERDAVSCALTTYAVSVNAV